MKQLLKGLIISVIFSLALPVIAVQIELHTFANAQQERVYLGLVAELRCVKCQNQNLAESNAELARDMRDKTYEMVTAGKNRDDVLSYMTARYGDFVLYKPPFKKNTLLLWIGPPILLLLCLFFLLKMVRNQSSKVPAQLSDVERESVRSVLGSHTHSNSSREK